MNLKGNLQITPYGGVAEIGSNMTVFETKNNLLVIDYGILFPFDDFYDLNYLIVNTSELQKSEKPITLFVTHGHEDHIGAIHHFIKKFPQTRLIAPRFASDLIKLKFEYKDITKPIEIYNEQTILEFDDFELHPIHVTHSIPMSHGLVFKKKDNSFSCLFISDFKYDENPYSEEKFNVQKIIDLMGSCKMRLAMLDSTNIMTDSQTVSESALAPAFEKILTGNKRTFITLFASNIFRLKRILETAKKLNKKVTTIGRSLKKYLEVAGEVGLINLDDYPIVEFDSISNYNDPKLIFIVTGSQGEHLGATKRIAGGDQKHITLGPGDQFLFSSKPIPGNEDSIYRIYNQISAYGTPIITFKDELIHASGHPGKEDLKRLIRQIDPTDYIPIHGEVYFLRKHVEFIKKHFPKIRPHYLTNFSNISFTQDGIKITEIPSVEPLLIHGDDIVIEKEKVSERRKIACNGLIVISANIKNQNINITTKGLPKMADAYVPKLRDIVDYQAFGKNKNRDYDYTTEQIRIAARNFYKTFLGYRPIVIVQLV